MVKFAVLRVVIIVLIVLHLLASISYLIILGLRSPSLLLIGDLLRGIVALIILVAGLVICGIFIIPVTIWAKRQKRVTGGLAPEEVFRRNVAVIVVSAFQVVLIVMVIVSISIPFAPIGKLVYRYLVLLMNASSVVGYIFLIESYALRAPRCGGYVLGLKGRLPLKNSQPPRRGSRLSGQAPTEKASFARSSTQTPPSKHSIYDSSMNADSSNSSFKPLQTLKRSVESSAEEMKPSFAASADDMRPSFASGEEMRPSQAASAEHSSIPEALYET
jgi:hypothetical protein